VSSFLDRKELNEVVPESTLDVLGLSQPLLLQQSAEKFRIDWKFRLKISLIVN
jgi:hypothetical protein